MHVDLLVWIEGRDQVVAADRVSRVLGAARARRRADLGVAMIADDIAGILHRAAAEHDAERRAWLLAEARAIARNRALPRDRSELLAEIDRVAADDARRGGT